MRPDIDLDPNTVCDASKADICFCNDAGVYDIGAIAIATANAHTADGGIVVTIDEIHGFDGGITVGQSLPLPSNVGGSARIGDALFVSIFPNPAWPRHEHTIQGVFPIVDGQLVLAQCDSDVPILSAAIAVEAALANTCTTHLAAVDESWGESHCDDGGCAIASGGSPAMLAVVVAAAVITMRSRRRCIV